MQIAIAGGTGFIGRHLCRHLTQNGHQVSVLTRNPARHRRGFDSAISLHQWDPDQGGNLESALEGADAVVNLVGEPIADTRWTARRKQILLDSRTQTTSALIRACSHLSHSPRTFVNASGIGFYGPRGDIPVTEQSNGGSGFLADLCRAWEGEALKGINCGVRIVVCRIGMVIGPDGGALSRMVLPFKLFLGGPILPGNQWISWIHIDDLVRLITWSITTSSIVGIMNGVAPGAVTMKEFCDQLGRSLHRPSWLPVPQFVLRAALGELATMMTTGQLVEPVVALTNGFRYTHPDLRSALESLWRKPDYQ